MKVVFSQTLGCEVQWLASRHSCNSCPRPWQPRGDSWVSCFPALHTFMWWPMQPSSALTASGGREQKEAEMYFLLQRPFLFSQSEIHFWSDGWLLAKLPLHNFWIPQNSPVIWFPTASSVPTLRSQTQFSCHKADAGILTLYFLLRSPIHTLSLFLFRPPDA